MSNQATNGLSDAEKVIIETMHRDGDSNVKIGEEIGRHESVVRKYLKRINAKPPAITPREAVLRETKNGNASMKEIAAKHNLNSEDVRRAVRELKGVGTLLDEFPGGYVGRVDSVALHGGRFQIQGDPRAEWTFDFGLTSDNHLCNRNSRLDVVNAAYDYFAAHGVTTVFNAGNWIDGEARFNRSELLVAPGMDRQLDYFIDNFPEREGITTHYIAGDDHEGWYQQREGVEVGKVLQLRAKDQGRYDLNYLGYGECDVALKVGKEEKVLRVVHAGGGSSYATSYKAQKLVECVPLSTQILTKSGWKTYDKIVVGEEVMGYNIEKDKCEWTKVKAVNRGVGEVVTYKNDQFKVRCTRNHRWAMEWESRAGANRASVNPSQYKRKDRIMGCIDDAKERTRIIQSAKCPSGDGLTVERSNMLDRGGAVQSVLKMTSEQRQSFIYGMMLGEGTKMGESDTLIFSQNPGAVQEAFVLACFMEGHAVGMTRKSSKKINGEEKICTRTTILSKRMRMVTKSMREVESSEEEVWCPTTELGTWVMRQDDVITITGNSFQGGEKPNILFIGHYHKAEYGYPREVHCFQAGCTEDQSLFMRKQHIAAHVGFWHIKIRVAPGEAVQTEQRFVPFYDAKFYSKKYR